MASKDGAAQKPTLSPPLKPTPHPESSDSNVTVALIEIGSLPAFSWGPFPSQKRRGHQVTDGQDTQRFERLLKEIKDVLKGMVSCEDKITDAEESRISKDVSDLKEKIRGLDKMNKMLLRNLLVTLNPEKGQKAMRAGLALQIQSSDGPAHGPGRPEEQRAPGEKAEDAPLRAPEEAACLRRGMEQLLQEAEHWSRQQTELSELIRSCQVAQKDLRDTLDNSGGDVQRQANGDVAARRELEEQARKLSRDTYSLHVVAALLENECQILQQRVEILREFHLHQQGTLPERPIPINPQHRQKNQKAWEAEKALPSKQGAFQKKARAYRSLDVCLSKKARNNRFNNHIARALMGKKRPVSSPR
ncbi:spermatogenic leucine zipper protein 1 [Lepus europaeus]|uniref:spermatogenic leucine zipper protein 1 n=1 Tax=Lepus europaeus TaxID=9983 RepID=UPI002B4810BE|nr:spermatogenic leucine zipper protein 1 [Lepus europaeus]